MVFCNENVLEFGNRLRAFNCQNEKVDSLHATAIKFIGLKKVVVYLFLILLLELGFFLSI